MEIFGETIDRELEDLAVQGVRCRFVGRRDRAPDWLRANWITSRLRRPKVEAPALDRLRLRRARRARRRRPATARERHRPRRRRRGRTDRMPLRARDAVPGPRHPDLASAESRTSSSGNLRTRSTSSPTPSGPTSGRTSCAPRSRSTRAGVVDSAADDVARLRLAPVVGAVFPTCPLALCFCRSLPVYPHPLHCHEPVTGSWPDFTSRLLVAAVGLPLVLGMLWLGGWWLFTLLAVASCVAVHEFRDHRATAAAARPRGLCRRAARAVRRGEGGSRVAGRRLPRHVRSRLRPPCGLEHACADDGGRRLDGSGRGLDRAGARLSPAPAGDARPRPPDHLHRGAHGVGGGDLRLLRRSAGRTPPLARASRRASRGRGCWSARSPASSCLSSRFTTRGTSTCPSGRRSCWASSSCSRR